MDPVCVCTKRKKSYCGYSIGHQKIKFQCFVDTFVIFSFFLFQVKYHRECRIYNVPIKVVLNYQITVLV